MRNPTFGKWLTDDYPESSGPSRETDTVDWGAQIEFDRVVERLSAPPSHPQRQEPQLEKPGKIRVSVNRGPYPAPGHVNKRPFTLDEADVLLRMAGIQHAGVIGTYLSDWRSTGTNDGQCIVTRMATEEGGELRRVHLHFIYDHVKNGWRLVKASVELEI